MFFKYYGRVPSQGLRVGLFVSSPRTSLWSGCGLFTTIPHAQKNKGQKSKGKKQKQKQKAKGKKQQAYI